MEKGSTYFSQAENVLYCSHLRTAFATAILSLYGRPHYLLLAMS